MIFLLSSLAAGLLTDCWLYRRFQSVKYPCTALFTLISCLILVHTFHDPFLILKGFLFTQSLIIIGFFDAESHIIPDWTLIPLAASGLIGFQPARSIAGIFSVSVLFFLVAWLTHGEGLGGGDVKLVAATGFVLGPAANMAGILIGIFLFLIAFFLIFHKKKMYAMAPWLGTGCFLAYILFN